MNENRKIPELRFPEYTDDWKDYRIGELFDERREKMPDGELLSVTIKDGIKKHSESGRRDSSSDDKSNYKKVCVGDIAYNSMRMWQGASGFSEYEGIISPAYTVIKPKENVDARCAAYLFKRKKMTNIFQRHSQGVASDTWNLKYPELSQIHIMFPQNVAEQHRISSFFSKIDSVIALQQQYVDQLKEFKKGCLQKMFPKKGEKVPEMRFPGFTDDWEQRKFSDVVDIESGMDYKHLGEGDIPVYGTGGYMLSVDAALSEDKDAIGIGRKGTIDKPYILRAPFWTVDTLFYCIPKDGYDLDFTSCLFQNVDWKKKDESTGVPSLSKIIINNVETAAPSYDEQRKIGDYFKGLDNLITLHQCKLDEMKEFKKGCLQKMFV